MAHKSSSDVPRLNLGVVAAFKDSGESVSERLDPIVRFWTKQLGSDRRLFLMTSTDPATEAPLVQSGSIEAHFRSVPPTRGFWSLEAASELDHPSWSFRLVDARETAGTERTTLLAMLLPPDASPRVLEDLCRMLVDVAMPYSASGGYYIATDRSGLSETFDAAYSIARRYWGADLLAAVARSYDSPAGLPSVNWLTFASHDLIRSRLGDTPLPPDHSAEVRVSPLGSGLIVIAGERPSLGDINRGEFSAVYVAASRYLEPLFVDEPTPLPGCFDAMKATRLWQRRFLEPLGWLEADPT